MARNKPNNMKTLINLQIPLEFRFLNMVLRRSAANIVLTALMIFLSRNAVAAAMAGADASNLALTEIGIRVETQYSGDALSVSTTKGGARLHCLFQRIEGDLTHEGLWLTSTAKEFDGDRFSVVAAAVGRA